jgi:hypothetical protein
VKTPGTAGAYPNLVPSRQFVEIGTQAVAMDCGVRISRPSRREAVCNWDVRDFLPQTKL